jgi:hypothetical protein
MKVDEEAVHATARGGSMIQRKLQDDIDRLRGQLQNCVNHLDRANRRDSRDGYTAAIESANKALYETL